ncbi:energy transducer TonB [bacterium]|nr:energy transducer TonB [bacterium]
MRESPTKELKLQYKKWLELGLVVALMVVTLSLQAFKRFEMTSQIAKASMSKLDVQEIPQTQQQKQTAAPARPSVPIASEDEDLLGDEDIDLDDLFDFDADLEPPPPPDEGDDDMFVFVPYDEPPEPVGGFLAIQKKLIYPEIARKAGVEGRVTVQAQIDVDGSVVRTKVVQSLGPNGCDEAAENAIRAVKWKPAKQRDRPVKVWIAVPVDFKLR